MSVSRAEARLVAAQQRRQRAARGATMAGTRSRALTLQVGTQMLRHQARLQARAAAYNRIPLTLPNPRLMEHKTFDSVASITGISNCFSNAGTVAPTPFAPVNGSSAFCLNQVPLGNSSVTRVGRRFANTAIALRGQVEASATTLTAVCAMVLVWDRNPNQGAAIPPFTTVFTTQDPESLTNKDNAPRFKILRRWVFNIIGNSGTAGQSTEKTTQYFDEFVKMKNKVTLLTAADTTGLITDMVEGSLLLYVMGDVAAGATAPNLRIQTRLYFQDH